MATVPPARLISTRLNSVPGKLKVAELFFDVPLDYSKPSGNQIRIFARSAEKLERPIAQQPLGKDEAQLPWMVYVSGGPGFGAPMPQDVAWTRFVLDRGYKILFFDHRGMGLSTPVTAATLAQQGTIQQQADYLKRFRADSAVKDLEAIRKCLTADYSDEKKKWSVMGQSYGGFVAMNYLSRFPEGLREVFTFGGLAPVTQQVPDDVMRRCFKKVEQVNTRYFEKYPEDQDRVRKVVTWLEEKKGVELSDRGRMSAQRFLQIGISFAGQGGFARVHDCVLRATNDLDMFGFLTRPTLTRIVGSGMLFDDHPIYAVLHEALYCQGQASKWAFSRLLDEFPKFNVKSKEEEIFFSGEVVLRDVFETHSELRALEPVAALLAEYSEWPDLYDIDQLRKNEVPVYAATYYDDIAVPFHFAQETAELIKGCKTYITNAMHHDAIRSNMEAVMQAVFSLRDDSID